MRRNALIGLLVFSLCVVTSTAVSAQQPQTRPTPNPAISLTLSAVQEAVKAPVKVKVTLTNQTDHQIGFGMSVRAPYHVDVWDGEGAAARETRLGAFRNGHLDLAEVSPADPITYDKYSTMTLKVGENWTWEINVSDLYLFDQVGRYRIQVSRYDSSGKTFVKSNAISIVVVP